MNYLSRRYGVYRLGGGRYLLSTMSAGIRCFDDRTIMRRKKRKDLQKVALMQAVHDHRPLFFVLAVAAAVEGHAFLLSLSILLLVLSLRPRKESR